jgi:hypothetical protein
VNSKSQDSSQLGRWQAIAMTGAAPAARRLLAGPPTIHKFQELGVSATISGVNRNFRELGVFATVSRLNHNFQELGVFAAISIVNHNFPLELRMVVLTRVRGLNSAKMQRQAQPVNEVVARARLRNSQAGAELDRSESGVADVVERNRLLRILDQGRDENGAIATLARGDRASASDAGRLCSYEANGFVLSFVNGGVFAGPATRRQIQQSVA